MIYEEEYYSIQVQENQQWLDLMIGVPDMEEAIRIANETAVLHPERRLRVVRHIEREDEVHLICVLLSDEH